MKVIVQSSSRIWGGNEKWLLGVARGMATRGHDVLVSCRSGHPVDQRARASGLRVSNWRLGGDADFARIFGFLTLLRRERPDALLVTAYKRAFWGGWAARRAGVPRVVVRLGLEQGLPAEWKYRKAFRDYVDALIVNSSRIRERWLRSAPWFPADEVHVVLNGVRRPASGRSTLREELRLGDEVPLIAAAGRLERRKGFDLLIQAFAAARNPRSRLLLAGSGPEEEALRGLAQVLGVSGRVHWLGFRDDLENVLLGSDVFVLASRREGMANVMLEAMAADCLVVATDISGVREAIGAREGRPEAGWIVPPEDPGSMAAALDRAVEAAARKGGMAETTEGRSRLAEMRWRVDHWFTPERTVEETEQVLVGGR